MPLPSLGTCTRDQCECCLGLQCLLVVFTACRHLQATRTTVRAELPGSHERPSSLLVLRLDSVAMSGDFPVVALTGAGV